MRPLKHLMIVSLIGFVSVPLSGATHAPTKTLLADDDFDSEAEAIRNLRKLNGLPIESDPIKFGLPLQTAVDAREIKELTAVLKEHVNMQFGILSHDMVDGEMRKHDASITSFRGGVDSGKPLGFYSGHQHIIFISEYKNVNPETIAIWANALHRFLAQNGGWFVKHDIGARFIHYSDKLRFANDFWKGHYKELDSMSSGARDRFLQEALMDGIVTYWFYETSQQQLIPTNQRHWIDLQVEFIEGKRQ
jgi:hypothetical protein